MAPPTHEHPDGARDGLRRVSAGGRALLTVARGGALHPLQESLAELLGAGRDALHAAVDTALAGPALDEPASLLAPVDKQEVWASGVTYRRSASARVEESSVGDVYELVYAAERPELFLKAPAYRVPVPGAPLRIRADSGWDVPEPELALVLDARGEIAGYLAADDISSRAIEGANPLYLPQAKIYDDALGLSGTIVLARDAGDVRAAAIELEIRRAGATLFAGATSVAEMQRSFEELVDVLFRELTHPSGAVLLTGTGVVPPDAITLRDGDEVRIAVDGVGVLQHRIYQRTTEAP
jgi:2-dehydro-3-deoxy-D-arabinonate dehydratase